MRLLRLELESDRPARRLGGVAKRTLVSQLIDFNHDSIRGVRQELPFGVPIMDIFLNLVYSVDDLPLVGNRQSPRCRRIQRVIMRRERNALAWNMIERAHQPSPRDLGRVKQFQRTRGRVPRIGERRILIVLALLVQSVK